MKRVAKLSKDEWDNLRYPIQLEQLSEEAGGGWLAWIPLLGRGAFMVDAETAQEAIRELEELRKSRYDLVIASGQPIPVPDDPSEEEALPSGKWLFRTTPLLHRRLQEAAEAQNISLNAYCNQVLERALTTDAMGSMLTMLQSLENAIKTNVHLLEESSREAIAVRQGSAASAEAVDRAPDGELRRGTRGRGKASHPEFAHAP